MSRSKFLDDRVSERGDELFCSCRGDDRVVFCREDEGWAAWTRGKEGFRFDRFELMAKRFFRVTLAPQGVPHRSDPARPPYDMGQVHTSDEIALRANPRVHRARSRRDYGPEACAENAHLTGLELGSRLDPVKRATHVPDALKNVLPELRWRRLDRQSSGWDAARRSAHVIRQGQENGSDAVAIELGRDSSLYAEVGRAPVVQYQNHRDGAKSFSRQNRL